MRLPIVSRARRQQRVKGLLPLNVGLRADMLAVSLAESAQGSDKFLCVGDGAGGKNRQHNASLAMYVFRKKRQGGSLAQHNPHVQLFGRRIYKLSILGKYLLCLAERKNDQAGDDLRTDGEKLEFELGDDAEISPAAANRPEKIRVVGLACSYFLTLGGDHVDGDEIVDRHAVFARQPTEAAAQG